MTDPYEVLGVSRNATYDEINTAYRKLVKQYHPDRYVGNPLADLAKEKIVEINAAYDAIIADRKKADSGEGARSSNSTNDGFNSNQIRILINQNRLAEAEALLNKSSIRNAEWHFLMGSLLKHKGWYDMAYQHFNRAADMEPSNSEYRNARDSMDYSGNMYRGMGNAGGYQADCCDTCQALMCADCCCEMCGGNLIPCCGCR